jgi:hypothetical protein
MGTWYRLLGMAGQDPVTAGYPGHQRSTLAVKKGYGGWVSKEGGRDDPERRSRPPVVQRWPGTFTTGQDFHHDPGPDNKGDNRVLHRMRLHNLPHRCGQVRDKFPNHCRDGIILVV